MAEANKPGVGNFSLAYFCCNSSLSPSGIIKNNMIAGEGYSPANSSRGNHWAFHNTYNSDHPSFPIMSKPFFATPRHYTSAELNFAGADSHSMAHSRSYDPDKINNAGATSAASETNKIYSHTEPPSNGFYAPENCNSIIWPENSCGYFAHIVDNNIVPWSDQAGDDGIRVNQTPNNTSAYDQNIYGVLEYKTSQGWANFMDWKPGVNVKSLRLPHYWSSNSSGMRGDNYTRDYHGSRGMIIARAQAGQNWSFKGYATHADTSTNNIPFTSWLYGVDVGGNINRTGYTYDDGYPDFDTLSPTTWTYNIMYHEQGDKWMYFQNNLSIRDFTEGGGTKKVCGITARLDNDELRSNNQGVYTIAFNSLGLMRRDISMKEMSKVNDDGGRTISNISLMNLGKGIVEPEGGSSGRSPIIHLDPTDLYCQERVETYAYSGVEEFEPMCRSTANWHEDIDLGDNLAEDAGADAEEVWFVGATGQPLENYQAAADANYPTLNTACKGVWDFGTDGTKGMNMQFDMGGISAITLQTWIKPVSYSQQYLADGRNGGGSWWILNYDSYNINIHSALKWNYGGGNQSTYVASNLPRNAWWMLTITSDSGGSKLYINGVDKTSECISSNSINEYLDINFRIGTRYNTTNGLRGLMGMFSVWDCVLTSTEVAQCYHSTKYRFQGDIYASIVPPSQPM